MNISKSEIPKKAEALYGKAQKLKRTLRELDQTPADNDRRKYCVEINNPDAKEGEINYGSLVQKYNSKIDSKTTMKVVEGSKSYSLEEEARGCSSSKKVRYQKAEGGGTSTIKEMYRGTGTDPSLTYMEGTELDGSALAEIEKAGELYPLEEGKLCTMEKDDTQLIFSTFRGGNPTDGNVLDSIDLQRGTKINKYGIRKQFDRLVFRQKTPENGNAYDPNAPLTQCKELGSFKVTYKPIPQINGRVGIEVKMRGIRRDTVTDERLEKIAEKSPVIEKIERWKEGMPGDYGDDDQAATFLITLKDNGGSIYDRLMDVYEVPNQGKIVIDLPDLQDEDPD